MRSSDWECSNITTILAEFEQALARSDHPHNGEVTGVGFVTGHCR